MDLTLGHRVAEDGGAYVVSWLGFAADPFLKGVLGVARSKGRPSAAGFAGRLRRSLTPVVAENFGWLSGRRQGFGAEIWVGRGLGILGGRLVCGGLLGWAEGIFLPLRAGPCPKGWWRGERIFVRPEFAPGTCAGSGLTGRRTKIRSSQDAASTGGGVGGVKEIFLSRGDPMAGVGVERSPSVA